jgi:sec-independent protein translocase protein TatB
MFDLSWGHMAIIAVVALLVLGPKELPNALRTASQWMRTARKLAGEFQSGVNEIIREADLDDARKQLQGLNTQTIQKHIENTVDPTGELKSSLTVEEPAAESSAPSIPAPAAETPVVADFDEAPTLPPSTTPMATEHSAAEHPVAETAGAAEKS